MLRVGCSKVRLWALLLGLRELPGLMYLSYFAKIQIKSDRSTQ